MPYILTMAAKYRNGPSGFALEDLVSAGIIGLLKAAQVFDTSKGYTFLTYAGRCIWGNMIRHMKSYGSVIRYPVHTTNDKRTHVYSLDEMKER